MGMLFTDRAGRKWVRPSRHAPSVVGALGCFLLLNLGTPAFADTAAPVAATAPDTLGEVVVTARKQSESLQKAPLP